MRRISVFARKPISRRPFTVLGIMCFLFPRHIGAVLTHTFGFIFIFAAFESSADDTAVAVVRSDRTVLSNVVIKQHAQCVSFQYSGVHALICSHEQYGGIQPSVAISWHQRNLVRVHTSPLSNTTEYPSLSSSHLRSNEPLKGQK